MGLRSDFHEKLAACMYSLGRWLWDPFNFETDDIETAIQEEARRHVYFQPPEGFKLKYPCIVYELDRIETNFANNLPYLHNKRYSVTVITKDPDSEIPGLVADLPMCSHDRHFVNDNLHHDVFTIYF